MKEKIIILCLFVFFLTGCTVVRVDTTNVDNIINVVLSKNNNLYNRVGIGYKYYVPRGLTYMDSTDVNDILYSNGVYYYLYLDSVSYYYKTDYKFKEDSSKYYSKKLDNGYLEITERQDKYLVEFVYNYAKIEALVSKDDIETVVLNSSYILSTIKYNKNVIKLSLKDDFLTNKKEKYEEFTSKKETDNFLRYE